MTEAAGRLCDQPEELGPRDKAKLEVTTHTLFVLQLISFFFNLLLLFVDFWFSYYMPDLHSMFPC